MQPTLEPRIARLERTNRMLVTTVIVGLVAMGSLALVRQPAAEVLRAQRIVLVDPATNQDVAVLTHDATGTFLRFTDEGGTLEVGVGRDRPRLVGEDQAGTEVDLFHPVPKVRRLR